MNEGFKNRREDDNEGKMDREPRYSDPCMEGGDKKMMRKCGRLGC